MITIFLPITRKDLMPGMAKQLAKLERPAIHKLNIVAIVDNKDIDTDEVRNILAESGIDIATCINTGNPMAGEINIGTRRLRITEVFNKARKLIPAAADFVFTIEDDTLIAPDTLIQLVDAFNQLPNPGLVSGVQVGRWGVKYCGVWRVDNVTNMTRITSLLPGDEKNLDLWEKVDTTGFYCFLTKADYFRAVHNKFGQFGPDIYFGLELRKMGLTNYVNWGIIAKHISVRGILIPDAECTTVTYQKTDDVWSLVKPATKIKIEL